jgi:hypothetical protein
VTDPEPVVTPLRMVTPPPIQTMAAQNYILGQVQSSAWSLVAAVMLDCQIAAVDKAHTQPSAVRGASTALCTSTSSCQVTFNPEYCFRILCQSHHVWE